MPLRFVDVLTPEMVLMDVQMPVMDGVEATRKIAQIYPDISVIMLTVAVDDESLFGALRCGAQGYVLKDTPSKELRERLQGAVRGETPLSGIVATKVVEQMKYIYGKGFKRLKDKVLGSNATYMIH